MNQTQDILTKEEAVKRSKAIKNVHYNLQLFLKKKSKKYSGKTEIQFAYQKSKDPLRIDFIGSIKNLQINNKKSDFQKNNFFILLPSKNLKEGKNTVHIEYENEYNHTGDGLHQFFDPEDQTEYLYSNFEPYDAHRMFPCFDQPDLKATYSLSVESPKEWKVISNSPQDKVLENKTKTTVFKKTKPFSTYLFFVAAGNYYEFQSKHKSIDMKVFCRQSMKKYIRYKEIFLVTKQGLDFYSKFFGYRYPFEKYDQIFVPEFNSGAMENPGAITFSESLVTRYKPTYTERTTLADVILHEMVHMWFGDLVTMKWWDDLWLNESFADFFSYFGLVEATEFKDAWQNFYSRKFWAYYQDQLITTHPIATDASDTDIAFSNFDGISYAKGAATLKQLMFYLGENTFKRGLQKYFKKYQWKNTELKDFLGCMTEAAGIDLQEWTKLWIETTGVNSIEPLFEFGEDGKLKSLSIKQNPSTGNNLLRPHKTQIGLFSEKNGKCENEKTINIFYKNSLTRVDEAIGLKPELIFLNYNDHDYVKDILDENSISYSLKNLGKINDNLTRQMILGSLWQLVRDSKLDPEKYLNLILNHSPQEENLLILETLVSRALQLIGYYVNDSKYYSYCERLYQLGWENIKKAPKENKDAWFSLIVSTSTGVNDQTKLYSLLEGKIKIENFEFNQEQRWDSIIRLSACGFNEIEKIIEKELKRDPSDKGRKSAFEAEVANIKNKDKNWKLFVAGKGHSLDYLRTGMGAFFWRRQKEDLRKYIDLFFENIEKVFEKQERVYSKAFYRSLFPSIYIEEQILEKGGKLLGKTIPPLLRKSVLESLDELKRTMKIRQTFP